MFNLISSALLERSLYHVRLGRQQHSHLGYHEGPAQRRAWRARESRHIALPRTERDGAGFVLVGSVRKSLGLKSFADEARNNSRVT